MINWKNFRHRAICFLSKKVEHSEATAMYINGLTLGRISNTKE